MPRLPLRKIYLTLALASAVISASATAREPMPEKLVVLTFDDAARSHYTVVRPLLKKYRFGATFFVTEGFDFRDNKRDYMTWDEIAELARDGFEIGNHTRDHLSITDENADQLAEQLAGIDQRCAEHGIARPTSFAWPGNSLSKVALTTLREQGIRFARRGGAPEYNYHGGRGFAYEPGLDHPLLIPSAGDARPDWELADFVRAVEQARWGRVAVLQFHGVPDTAHSWVNTPAERFEQYLHYLAAEGYRVVALRDLQQYVDPQVTPNDPWGVIEDRQAVLASDTVYDEFRIPQNDDELRFWLTSALVDHRYSFVEAAAATGLTTAEISKAVERLQIDRPSALPQGRVRVLPYPGGRHPRTGFRDGAIRPQRDTKLSLFLPWDGAGYVVADLPEAIWWQTAGGRQLLYLAHTHVKTTWDLRGERLAPVEWQRTPTGWRVERTLPNGVQFGAEAEPRQRDVLLKLWLHNGSQELLEGLSVQNCVMLAGAPGFDQLTTENKRIESPAVACHDPSRTRWIVTAWQNCVRPWANPPCPCMHSDPQFADCPPGETRELRGVISFFEGSDVQPELRRVEQLLTE